MLTALRTTTVHRPSIRRYLGAAIVVLLALALLIPPSRHGLLRLAGRSLVAEDPLVSADVVVVTLDGGPAGVLDAADLVHQGVAARVALLGAEPTPAERELTRRGVAYEDAPAASARYLKALGVVQVERIQGSVDGTHTAGRLLRDWCAERRIASEIVLSSADHSRRLRRVVQRSMRGSSSRVAVRFSRFSTFDPDSWWWTRAGIRLQLVETEKLLLDIASHPWS
jgi:hypothetical protein